MTNEDEADRGMESETDKLAEVAATADRKRQQRTDERPESSGASRVGVDVTDVKTKCRYCGEVFHTTRIGGYVPRRCPVCIEKMIDEQQTVASSWSKPAGVLDAMSDMGVNVRDHGSITIDEMALDEICSAPVHSMMDWIDDATSLGRYESIDGIYIQGGTGTGKTQLAVSAIRATLEAGYTRGIVFDRARALVTTIWDVYGTGKVGPVIDERRDAGIWVLDDVGTEKFHPDSFRIIEDILDCRMGWPTIWTSNYSPEELSDIWSDQAGHDRFRSRLGGFRYLTLGGGDRRFS